MPGKTGAGLEVIQAPGAPVVPEGIFVSGAWHSPASKAVPEAKHYSSFNCLKV